MRKALWILLLVLIASYCAPSALAQYTFTYTGNHFNQFTYNPGPYTTADFVTVTFTIPTLPNALPTQCNISPTSFTISDGVQTFTKKDTNGGEIFCLATDINGNIVGWNIATGPSSSYSSYISTSSQQVYAPDDVVQYATAAGPVQAFVANNPGKWVRTGVSQTTIEFLGAGTSSLFLELGQAAVNVAGGTGLACTWSHRSDSYYLAMDERQNVGEQGDLWVVWTPGSGTCVRPAGSYRIWSYMLLDSVIGNRCYFEMDSSGIPGCLLALPNVPPVLGDNLLCYPSSTTCTLFGDTAGGLAQSVMYALNAQHFFVAGTDIRPEDAKFASYRMFIPCQTTIPREPFDQIVRSVYGLGYGSVAYAGVGTNVQSSYSTALSHTFDFNITGNDPMNTGAAVPAYTVVTVGAQPVVVAVGPNDTTGTGLNLATDIPSYVLMSFYNGALARATDLMGPTERWAVTTLVREPLSGDYNVLEWSAINNSQFHSSQDAYNCNHGGGVLNPMNLQSLDGYYANAGLQTSWRRRVIGTSEMTTQLQAATDTDNRLGYFFWNAGSASGLTNVKYLTVNGIDPLQDSYTNGTLPGSGGPGDPGIGAVTFKNLNAGEYPIWSPLRIVSRPSYTTAVNTLVSAVQTLNSTQHDMISLANLNVWHSHYSLPAIGISTAANGTTISTPNDLCNAAGALPEQGGDAGGATILKQANFDFCQDFSNVTGLINKTN